MSEENIAIEETTPVENPEINDTTPEPEAEEVATTDEYGNDLPKEERMFKQSEVERMMQERLERDRRNRPTEKLNPPEPEPTYEEPNAQPGDWQEELNQFVNQAVTRREQELKEKQWREEAFKEQQKFENKFNQGMLKYNDFQEVVAPIAPLLNENLAQGLHGIENPAAFIYTIAKHHQGEFEKISKMNNPIQQIAALGALEATIKKNKNMGSNAPKPIDREKGDYSSKSSEPRTNSVDHILRQQRKRQ